MTQRETVAQPRKLAGLRKLIREHPVASLTGTFVVGFLAAKLTRVGRRS